MYLEALQQLCDQRLTVTMPSKPPLPPRARLASLQASWQQYNLGLLPLDAWQLAERRIFATYDSCQFRDVFVNAAQPKFLEHVRSNSESYC